MLLLHHLLLLLLCRLLGDDLAWQQLLLLLRRLAPHVSAVVCHLTVTNTAHQTAIVEILWTVVRVAKVLLEVLRGLIIAIGGVIQLHVGAALVRDASTGLKLEYRCACHEEYCVTHIIHGL